MGMGSCLYPAIHRNNVTLCLEFAQLADFVTRRGMINHSSKALSSLQPCLQIFAQRQSAGVGFSILILDSTLLM